MVESSESGAWEITIEEEPAVKLGWFEIVIEETPENPPGWWEITIEEEEVAGEVVEEEDEEIVETFDFEEDIELRADTHMYPVLGAKYEMNLEPGLYVLKPTGGAVSDNPTATAWTWHARTSVGDLGGTYSCEQSAGPYAPSREAAFDTVEGESLVFSWEGGVFVLWIAHTDLTNNNLEQMYLNIKRVA